MTSSHISITLSDSGRNGQITVFTIHVWVPERESYRSQIPKFLIFKGFFSWISSTDDFAGSFLEFPQLTQEIPETRFSNDWAGSKDSHPVQWSLGLLFSRQFTSDDTELPERSLCFHLDIIIFHLSM